MRPLYMLWGSARGEEEEEEEEGGLSEANEELDGESDLVGSQNRNPSYVDMMKSLHVEDMHGEEMNDR